MADLQRLKLLAEHLRKPENFQRFDMKWTIYGPIIDRSSVAKAFNECGTVGCFAGHAVWLFNPVCSTSANLLVEAQQLLDLSKKEADKLFDEFTSYPYSYLSPEAALQRLDTFIASLEKDNSHE
jgi:hypothetical protein